MPAKVVAYQLHLELREVEPTVWRRLLVRSDTSLAQLHFIVQAAMGWEDVHLHQFRIHGRQFGIAREGGISFRDDPWKVRLADFRLQPRERFVYEYDFGDFWQHDLRLEKTPPLDPKKRLPTCIAGEHACPPEDCGGPDAYKAVCDERWGDEHLETMRTVLVAFKKLADGEITREEFREDEDLRDAMDRFLWWEKYNPERFDRKVVNKRLREVEREVEGADNRG